MFGCSISFCTFTEFLVFYGEWQVCWCLEAMVCPVLDLKPATSFLFWLAFNNRLVSMHLPATWLLHCRYVHFNIVSLHVQAAQRGPKVGADGLWKLLKRLIHQEVRGLHFKCFIQSVVTLNLWGVTLKDSAEINEERSHVAFSRSVTSIWRAEEAVDHFRWSVRVTSALKRDRKVDCNWLHT